MADWVWICALYFLIVLLTTPLVPFVLPVNLDTHVQEVVDPVGALDHGEWALHPAAGEEQRVHRAERGLG
jgi:hypothetical protein